MAPSPPCPDTGDSVLKQLARTTLKPVAATRKKVRTVAPSRLLGSPHFMLIGAQKTGTSSLYSWMTKHPDVLAARSKELHYFNRHIESKPLDAYLQGFPLQPTISALSTIRRRPVVTGEATPAYLFHPLVPQRVHRHFPDARLIVILREPAERARSHYWMKVNRGTETLSFEQAIASEQDRIRPELEKIGRGESPGAALQRWSYLARGHYAEQLERWLSFFRREQLLILQFEQLVEDPAQVYTKALTHLGIDPDIAPMPALQARRVGSKQEPDPNTTKWLKEHFRESNERLNALAGINYNR